MFKYSKILIIVLFFISGCATIPPRENIPTYTIGGTTYYSLISLCDLRNIDWQYDTFARTLILSKDSHRINLKVGDTLVLVDGSSLYLNHPVDIYQGAVVVPYKFKEQILDVLFKESYPPAQKRFPLSTIKKIVIDAGHGGNDPGAIGRTGLREKDVNLDIAKRLVVLLRGEGVDVVLTRSTDTFVALSRRVEIANNSKADIFISIHSNANHVKRLSGFEVYYVAMSVNDSKRAMSSAKSATLNLEGASFASHSLDLKAILWDMIYTYDRAESIELSRSICKSIENNLDVRILGVKGAVFQVLRGVRMPAVLIEVGFLSNYNEERKLKNGYYRQKIADSILEGIQGYAEGAILIESAKR